MRVSEPWAQSLFCSAPLNPVQESEQGSLIILATSPLQASRSVLMIENTFRVVDTVRDTERFAVSPAIRRIASVCEHRMMFARAPLAVFPYGTSASRPSTTLGCPVNFFHLVALQVVLKFNHLTSSLGASVVTDYCHLSSRTVSNATPSAAGIEAYCTPAAQRLQLLCSIWS